MLQRILVATDFSPAARRAVSRAAQLAHETGAQLTMLHVLPERGFFERLFGKGELDYAQIASSAAAALRSEAEAVQSRLGVQASNATLEGPAHRVIGMAAAAHKADLVVLGARGENESAVRGAMLGGTALKCFSGTRLPLLLVRRDVSGPYAKVLAAVDGTPASRAALVWALELSRSAAGFEVLHAYEAPFAARLRAREIAEGSLDVYASEQRERAERTLAELIAQLKATDRARPVVVRGEPTQAILREIEQRRPELLVVGKHGQRARELTPESFGSVSLRIASDAPLDVLVVP